MGLGTFDLKCKAWPCPCQVRQSQSPTCTGDHLRRGSRSPRVAPCLTCTAWAGPLRGVTAVMTNPRLPDLKHRCMRTWRWVEMAPVEVAQNLTVTSRTVMNPTEMSLWGVPVETEKIMPSWHHQGVTRGKIHSVWETLWIFWNRHPNKHTTPFIAPPPK